MKPHIKSLFLLWFSEFQEQFEEENTTSPASHHLATAMGVKSHRMQVMKASFFAQSEEPQRRYINNNDMRPREFRLGTRSVLHSTGFDEFDGKSMHERPIYSPVKTKSMTIYPESPSRDDTRGAKERRIGSFVLIDHLQNCRFHFNFRRNIKIKAHLKIFKRTARVVIDRMKKDGDMYILPEFTAGIKT